MAVGGVDKYAVSHQLKHENPSEPSPATPLSSAEAARRIPFASPNLLRCPNRLICVSLSFSVDPLTVSILPLLPCICAWLCTPLPLSSTLPLYTSIASPFKSLEETPLNH